MTFFIAASGGNCSTCVWIAAQGIITNETPAEFAAFLDEAQAPRTVRLDSSGGLLLPAMELGRLFREHELHAMVESTRDASSEALARDMARDDGVVRATWG